MTTCKCPTCGATLHIYATAPKKQKRRGLFESSTPQHFDRSVAPAYPQRQAQIDIAPGTTRDVKHSRPEMPIDVATFALKSFGFGVAASLVSIWPTFGFDLVPWYTPLAVLPTVTGLAWFAVSGRAQGLITFTEKITKLDLNGDGKIGKSKQERTVEVIVKTDESKRHDQRVNLPDTAEMFEFAMCVLNGSSFNEEVAHASGFSRAKWLKIRDLFLDRGWIVWKDKHNHNAGLSVMAAGRSALRGCLPYPDDPVDGTLRNGVNERRTNG